MQALCPAYDGEKRMPVHVAVLVAPRPAHGGETAETASCASAPDTPTRAGEQEPVTAVHEA